MARMESKSLTCKPSDENATIQKFQHFGWSLDSSQEIYNKDSHLENRGGTTYSITETTNYVKLVFKRDMDMPYYNEIISLEKQYDSIPVPPPSFSKGLKILIWVGILLMFFLTLVVRPVALKILFDIIAWGGVGGFFALNSRAKKADNAANLEMLDKQSKILNEVANYV